MRYLLQILASLLYTSLFAKLIAVISVVPIVWLFSLSTFWMVVILFFFLGLFYSLIILALSLVTIPYGWIVKENVVALGISIILFVVQMVFNCIKLWQLEPEGFWEVTGIVILTYLLIKATFGVFTTLIGFHKNN